ncbi:3-hydroxyisobutyryl-CoA hydrolase [Bacillaceae bacterium SAS-127]|nr:3-hydroxyisobutyryl-CoA hydrolase [Bacillaceae bacterium SAS-127]
MTQDVLFATNNHGIGLITLNRPESLNALSLSMIAPIFHKLQEWENDDQVQLIIMKGSGSKAFCAGGDIKTLYEAKSSDASYEKAMHFFEQEYELDQYIYRYPKPILACLDGIVMGGGVGLTYGCSHRIVTDKTKWAMPEMNIGFFPDVGAAYFLNQAPGHIGRYIALTASVIRAADVLYSNGADYYIEQDQLTALLAKIEATNWLNENVRTTLELLLNSFSEQPLVTSELAKWQKDIDRHFANDTIEDILQSLERDGSGFATKTKETLLSKAPLSLKVTLQQLIRGKDSSLEECFQMDYMLAKNFLKQNDFYEGVRSVLIDKDHAPNYQYQKLSDISDEFVDRFFLA